MGREVPPAAVDSVRPDTPTDAEGRVATPISACIITFQAVDCLATCIRSLDFCSEILVVDAHSTDGTRELAARMGARVMQRDWPGFRSQKEFAIRVARHDWVLCLDADERLSERLRDRILFWQRHGFGAYSGFRLTRALNYFGRFLRHGTAYPDRLVRLFDRRRGGWYGHEVHENTRVQGQVLDLEGDIEHYAYRSLSDQAWRLQCYARLKAEAMYTDGRRGHLLRVFLNPLWCFVRGYLLRGGFQDGWRGLLYAYMESEYVRQKYIWLFLIGKGLEACQCTLPSAAFRPRR
jgi:glycosyltransferase involved in cell wall biosynthesis